jgi:hypothetical protein
MLYQVRLPDAALVAMSLKYHKAMILATRPILLHLARESAKGQNQIIVSKPLESLAETCIDAARHTLNILCALQRQHLIGEMVLFAEGNYD